MYLLDSKTIIGAHGAVGDGQADDTDAIQAAMDERGAVFLPAGVYRTTKPLEVHRPDVNLYGEGMRGPRMESNTGAVILSDHGGPCIRVSAKKYTRGFSLRYLSLQQAGEDKAATAAGISFDLSEYNLFPADFELHRIAISEFGTAIEVWHPEPRELKKIGMLRITSCTIRNNGSVLRCENWTGINHLVFRDNYCSFNKAGLKISGVGLFIDNNIMEGVTYTGPVVEISGPMSQKVRITGTHAEKTTKPVIVLDKVNQCRVQDNYFLNLQGDDKTVITSRMMGRTEIEYD